MAHGHGLQILVVDLVVGHGDSRVARLQRLKCQRVAERGRVVRIHGSDEADGAGTAVGIGAAHKFQHGRVVGEHDIRASQSSLRGRHLHIYRHLVAHHGGRIRERYLSAGGPGLHSRERSRQSQHADKQKSTYKLSQSSIHNLSCLTVFLKCPAEW